MPEKIFYTINNVHQDLLLQAYRGIFAMLIIAGIVCQVAVSHPLISFIAAAVFSKMFYNLEKAILYRKRDVDFFQKLLLKHEHLRFKESLDESSADYHLFKSMQDCLGNYDKALSLRTEKIALDTFFEKEVMSGHKSATRGLIDSTLRTCALCGVWLSFVNTLIVYKFN